MRQTLTFFLMAQDVIEGEDAADVQVSSLGKSKGVIYESDTVL